MFHFGKAHPKLQQFDCSAPDFESLLQLLPVEENPFTNWQPSNIVAASSDITTWFPQDEQHPVLHSYSPSGSRQTPPLMYSDLHKCITMCPPYHQAADVGGPVTVALLLPATMMAEMAVTLVSLMAKENVCVAPLDANMTCTKLRQAFKQLQCSGIVTTKEILESNFINETDFDDVRVVESTGEQVGVVRWTVLHQKVDTSVVNGGTESLNKPSRKSHLKQEHPILLLRTSGTTSLPKVVPLTASSLLYNATCLSASLKLQKDDVGCNAMPLFHIGGVSCALLSVLVSGSSVVMMGPFDPDAFLDCLTTERKGGLHSGIPTWYYGVPSMHRTLTLTARARMQEGDDDCFQNNLRFIRSGAAHLPHTTAVELSKVFKTNVIPTYSMSETMPICSSHETPVAWSNSDDTKSDEAIPNSVGHPIGCSLRIVNELGNALPYGSPGEVALLGAGVMVGYGGVDRIESHTPAGWLRTGDVGEMDSNGNLKLIGRLKEMIKRGGDQVWPNEVDRVVEMVDEVSTAVTFGVPNDLWGEEVAVAVVATTTSDLDMVRQLIFEKCREHLDHTAVPSQVIFVSTTGDLLKGPTGKYLRTRLANHLQVKSVDTGALRLLEARANQADNDTDIDKDLPSSTKQEALPSAALNGVRLIAACFVVQGHIGLYPNNAWIKIASFSLNMQIFFILGGFQLACSVKNSVARNWAEWVGTKIGTMHALFVVTQFIALPSYLLFMCGSNGYLENFEEETCQESGFWKSFLPQFVVHTATGMVPREESVNPPAWFQTAFYMFLMVFPPLDGHLRKRSPRGLAWRLALNLTIATVFFVFVQNWLLQYLMIGWLPTLVSAMIAGYFFSRYAAIDTASTTVTTTSFFWNKRFQGALTDILSLVFLILEILVVLSPDCLYIEENDFVQMRPGEDIPKDIIVDPEGTTYVYACEITHDEYVEYFHSQSDSWYNGRWPTTIAMVFGWGRVGTPLVLLWLYAMAHGRGLTVRLFSTKLFQYLSPLAYPLYLLHLPIARYYWIATRGLEAEFWWPWAASYPVPVEWYETFIIIGISLLVGGFLDRFVVSFLSRYTVRFGVIVCRAVARLLCFCCCCCSRPDSVSSSSLRNLTDTASSRGGSNLEQIQKMVRRITGMEIEQITRSTNLKDLGLDSLGTTALLGTLKASSIPSAKKLTLKQLIDFETIGDLVDALDAFDAAAGAFSGSGSSSTSIDDEGEKTENEV